ncbi:hypothetical protein EC2726800_5193 [Escherichia coli 2726800]|nr:hypothetical protein ECP03023081_5042 [Escherichia coli P0302308.1]EMX70063.1 hypothetical protein EC2726800_5193 [Escherichia coli 2726800]ENC94561.1 hypothetical protein ECP030230810_4980 [Escherichia coli P0302308.10]END07088.1 hypothetical protein ECP03023083_4818 [Escherichia coli P0302308.3]END26006.1 hypothetical protein ECP03023085_5107 [Escherichia coli P0302308.5]ENH15524.1 hypothetical protein ECP030230814_4802 [Escherichia coli P0302308.14]ENH28682.1 hypothetical protein ECP030
MWSILINYIWTPRVMKQGEMLKDCYGSQSDNNDDKTIT